MNRVRWGQAFWAILVWGLLTSSALAAVDQLWLISTREAPSACCQGTVGPEAFCYHRLDDSGQWAAADLPAFLASSDPAMPTTIFIHGNRTDAQRAVDMGFQFYQQLKCQSNGRPFRMVIWSWPSDRVCGGARLDAQTKACRSDAESLYLAAILDRLPAKAPVALIGYSFGARVITGSLELLAGGSVACQTLSRQTTAALRIRAVLIAAAEDSDWLAAGHRNGQAIGQTESMLIIRNLNDPVLRRYGLMYHIGGPDAMGFTGPCCVGAEDQKKVELIDLSCEVGRYHDWDLYSQAPSLLGRLPTFTFLAD